MRVGINILAPETPGEDVPKGVEVIRAPQAWTYTRGAGTRVAILSSGIFTPHQDLLVSQQVNFVPDDSDPQDKIGAGTNCAGIIAALRNSLGIVGVAPEAELVSVKVLSADGSATLDTIYRALDWCITAQPDVVVLPFGGAGPCPPEFATKLSALSERGSVTVCGPRGSQDGPPIVPGCCPTIISVGAPPNEWQSDKADVFCWAGRMKTTAIGGGWEYWTSTVTSLSLVAGAIALLKSLKSELMVDDIRELLRVTSDDAGSTSFPYKQVNAFSAAKKCLA